MFSRNLLLDRVSYVPSANKVVVPEYLLRPPLFHPAAPYSVNLGGLGVMIAEAVVEGVLGAGSVFTASGGPSILKSSVLLFPKGYTSILFHHRHFYWI